MTVSLQTHICITRSQWVNKVSFGAFSGRVFSQVTEVERLWWALFLTGEWTSKWFGSRPFLSIITLVCLFACDQDGQAKEFNQVKRRCELRRSVCTPLQLPNAWWRHQMEAFPALLALCAGNSPVTVSVEFPSQRLMTPSFDVFFDLCPNKRLSK